MRTPTSLTIWPHWEQAGSSGSCFAGRGETGFAGSSGSGIAGKGESGIAATSGSGPVRKTVHGVYVASLVAEKLDTVYTGKEISIWLCWEQAGRGGSGFAPITLTCLVSPL